MAFHYDEILRSQAENLQAQQQLAAAELEAARIVDDAEGVHAAADRILHLDLMRNALGVRAQNYVNAQITQSQGNRYGLSQDELDVAHGSFGTSMSKDEKERLYAENKARYQHMRATGVYRDDQGSVRR
jgi:hypothetical protein